jgi:hypothetical protein
LSSHLEIIQWAGFGYLMGKYSQSNGFE